ncbi:hypothetical protein AAV99_03500 [Aurantiacibacter marinus]|uniref:Acetyltransferase n=1 Tax=Aurantiacibacter marinus TaxID=874156 RepID=A0A0H0XTB8_9SPHN|nr:hypothetical protein AAV99_03500 [Aurantiacibacter marinus]
MLTDARRRYLNVFKGTSVHETARLSLAASLRSSQPGGIVIGAETLVAFKTLLITDDAISGFSPITVGSQCFIGGGSTLLPGTVVGNNCIIGSGSVVAGHVPDASIAVGNPARIIKSNQKIGPFGQLEIARENRAKARISN